MCVKSTQEKRKRIGQARKARGTSKNDRNEEEGDAGGGGLRVKAYIGDDRPSRISKQCDERARRARRTRRGSRYREERARGRDTRNARAVKRGRFLLGKKSLSFLLEFCVSRVDITLVFRIVVLQPLWWRSKITATFPQEFGEVQNTSNCVFVCVPALWGKEIQ